MFADRLAHSPLFHPSTELPRAAAQRQWAVPLLLATAAALLFSIAAVPRIDFDRAAAEAIDASPDAAQMSPHDRETKIEQARKVGALASYTGASFGTGISTLLAALGLWLGFRVAGSKPGFVSTFTVLCWALVPGAIASLLTLPAVLLRPTIPVEQLTTLLPSSLAAFLPAGSTGALAGLLGALDLFTAWALWMVVAGMAGVAQVSRRRSVVTVLVLWIAYVALFRVALPALAVAGQA